MTDLKAGRAYCKVFMVDDGMPGIRVCSKEELIADLIEEVERLREIITDDHRLEKFNERSGQCSCGQLTDEQGVFRSPFQNHLCSLLYPEKSSP